MMRILHLVDPATCGDEGILACAAAIAPGPAPAYPTTHDVWIIGDEHAERRAWSLGISSTSRIHPRGATSGRREFLGGLRRLWSARRESFVPHIVQCYSLDTFRAARACFGGPASPARIAVLPRSPIGPARHQPASDLDLASGREVIATFDDADRHRLAPLIGHPDDAARWLPTIRLLDPPAFQPGGPIELDRTTIRESLGLDPADVALAWLADPPAAIDAMHAAYSSGVLHAAGHGTVSLVRHGSRQERRSAAYIRTHSRRWGMLLVDLSLPELLAAADVCVIEADAQAASTCGPIAASLALSMNVPIAAGLRTFATRSESPWPAQPAISPAPGRIAVPIAAILEVESLRVGLASAARAWSDAARARDGFRSTLHDLWAECAPHAAPSIMASSGLSLAE
jgi:hypothetical protein